MCSKYQIDKWIGFLNLIYYMLFLHHTSKKNDLHIWIVILQTVQVSQSSVYLQVRVFTNSTCIIDHNICFFIVLSVIPDLIHNTGHCL